MRFTVIYEIYEITMQKISKQEIEKALKIKQEYENEK
jgi:hypothetical protein